MSRDLPRSLTSVRHHEKDIRPLLEAMDNVESELESAKSELTVGDQFPRAISPFMRARALDRRLAGEQEREEPFFVARQDLERCPHDRARRCLETIAHLFERHCQRVGVIRLDNVRHCRREVVHRSAALSEVNRTRPLALDRRLSVVRGTWRGRARARK